MEDIEADTDFGLYTCVGWSHPTPSMAHSKYLQWEEHIYKGFSSEELGGERQFQLGL